MESLVIPAMMISFFTGGNFIIVVNNILNKKHTDFIHIFCLFSGAVLMAVILLISSILVKWEKRKNLSLFE